MPKPIFREDAGDENLSSLDGHVVEFDHDEKVGLLLFKST
jgi:hypothetical protein